jgi:hypothetical protein
MLAVLSFNAADDVPASAQQHAMMIAMVGEHAGYGEFTGYFAQGDERRRGRSEIDDKKARRVVLVTALIS